MRVNGKLNVRYMTMTAILSAISAILTFFEFALPFFPGFLNLDFADLPALLAAFMLGPAAGVLVEFIKNAFHFLRSNSGGIGQLANFIIGCSLVIPAGLVYKRNKTRRSALTGMLLGIVAMSVVAGFANYYLLIPFYTQFMPIEAIIAMSAAIVPLVDSMFKVVLFGVVPFNIFKGLAVSALTFLLYKRLHSFIKRFV